MASKSKISEHLKRMDFKSNFFANFSKKPSTRNWFFQIFVFLPAEMYLGLLEVEEKAYPVPFLGTSSFLSIEVFIYFPWLSIIYMKILFMICTIAISSEDPAVDWL